MIAPPAALACAATSAASSSQLVISELSEEHLATEDPTGQELHSLYDGHHSAEESRSSDESGDEEAFYDAEWEHLCQQVAVTAEELQLAQPNMCLPAALLKALWSREKEFGPSLVARYQVMVAEGIAAPDVEASEADKWFGEAPDHLDLW